MPLKKTNYKEDEIALFDEAVIYKRSRIWQMRMWLVNEKKQIRISLRTTNIDVAKERAKSQYIQLLALKDAGKKYFSLTAKQGVEIYLAQRLKDVEAGYITIGRHKTLAIHLKHWLDVIGRDTKLTDLHEMDCENYYLNRRKHKNRYSLKISQSTILNEQATINAMMGWLYKTGESKIAAFEFSKFKRADKGKLELRRPIFSKQELKQIRQVIKDYIKESLYDINDENNLSKVLCGCFIGLLMITGMRRGELVQLQCGELKFDKKESEVSHRKGNKVTYLESIVSITVLGETSKVRTTRTFKVVDEDGYIIRTLYVAAKRIGFDGLPILDENKPSDAFIRFILRNFSEITNALSSQLLFSVDGMKKLSYRALYIHFKKIIELAGIEDADKRGVVPYSFRHSFITHAVNNRTPFIDIAEWCGTSSHQIEKTYYRTTQEKMSRNALQSFNSLTGED